MMSEINLLQRKHILKRRAHIERVLFYGAIGAFVAGIVAAEVFGGGVVAAATAGVLALALFVLSFSEKESHIVLIGALVCACVALGMLRLTTFQESARSGALDGWIGSEVAVEARVVDEVVIQDGKQKIVAEVQTLNAEDIFARSRAVIYAPAYPRVVYGDVIALEAELAYPQDFETENGRVFGYRKYLLKDRVEYTLLFPYEVEVVKRGGGSVILRSLYALKDGIAHRFAAVLGEPHSALLAGITVGKEESLGSALEDQFRRTGIIHIVVLSGYNVAIVAIFILWMLGFLPLRVRTIGAALAIVAFALLVGASATIVRASIMVLLVIFARTIGRERDMARALVFAGFLMLLHNPMILLHDPSFQLSFLATFGLISVAPLLERHLMWVPHQGGFREIVVATIATQMLVMPLLVWMSGEFSLVALPVNLLILPIVPLAMLFGGAVAVLGTVPVLAELLSSGAYVLLEYMLVVVKFFDSFAFASVSAGNISLGIVLTLYTLGALALWKLHRDTKEKYPVL